ncbi:hypothetical protein PFICI_06100 [Pestalotiopsis fici W106-1]|uniref:Amino acid permease/ SLC12A domain-containing protein n=1 Tax=Pestalotiopsis fici (strain W106-1 / CGMCC3.15140) TaxID=1229662 RepID=W3X4P1_PESFW|nr:uncharacterized protein PFICI_06100 [Pestalotiopsis fici W106-1]ETS81098.1 hypothetical protein PFICI_06100 [Pestalotiopsis fici W106-1]
MAEIASSFENVNIRSFPKKELDPVSRMESLQPGFTERSLAPNEETHRGFKPRHAQMIAIGGAIGTSLFLGSGMVLRVGGPGFLLLSYALNCLIVYGIMTAIAEVATYSPVPGATMSYFADRYVSRSFGVALGYLYWYSLGILVPYELTATTLLMSYWNPTVSPALWMSIILLGIIIVNFLPVSYYGEVEFWSAGLKVLLIIGLICFSFILCVGGGPSHDRLGFRYWVTPGATKTYILEGGVGRLIACLQCFVLASFAFVLAPEQLIVTVGEMQSAEVNLPKASRRYFWRLLLLFIPTVVGIGVVCPSNAEDLDSSGASSSPFVIAIRIAGIPALDSIVNALVLSSAITAANAFLYSSSRNLYSLAVARNAPSIFRRCNKHGLPYISVATSALFGGLAYMSLSSTSLTVFNWLINLTNTSGYISWIGCSIIYFRFRKSCDYKEITPPYRSRLQPWAVYFSLFASLLLLFLNGFTVFFPSQWSYESFLTSYIGIPAFLAIYICHRCSTWNDPWLKAINDIEM